MIIIIRLIYYKKIISCDYQKLKLNRIEFKVNIITLKRIKINFYNISKNVTYFTCMKSFKFLKIFLRLIQL